MNNKLTAKGVVAIGFILVGFILGRVSVSEPEPVMVDIESKYCFYAEYESIDNFDATQRPQSVFISFFNGKVRVYADCDSIYFYDREK